MALAASGITGGLGEDDGDGGLRARRRAEQLGEEVLPIGCPDASQVHSQCCAVAAPFITQAARPRSAAAPPHLRSRCTMLHGHADVRVRRALCACSDSFLMLFDRRGQDSAGSCPSASSMCAATRRVVGASLASLLTPVSVRMGVYWCVLGRMAIVWCQSPVGARTRRAGAYDCSIRYLGAWSMRKLTESRAAWRASGPCLSLAGRNCHTVCFFTNVLVPCELCLWPKRVASRPFSVWIFAVAVWFFALRRERYVTRDAAWPGGRAARGGVHGGVRDYSTSLVESREPTTTRDAGRAQSKTKKRCFRLVTISKKPHYAAQRRGALGAAQRARCQEPARPQAGPLARREGRRKAALAAPAGAGSGGGDCDGGRGDGRDAGGRAAATSTFLDAHSRTCDHRPAIHRCEKDEAGRARVQAAAAPAHIPAGPKVAPRRPLVGWRGGQRPDTNTHCRPLPSGGNGRQRRAQPQGQGLTPWSGQEQSRALSRLKSRRTAALLAPVAQVVQAAIFARTTGSRDRTQRRSALPYSR